MSSKFVTAFFCILFAILLFSLPLSLATYDFRTDLEEQDFYAETGAGETSVSVVLAKAIYNDDTSTLSVTSDLDTDNPTFVSYNTASRSTEFNGLTANDTRTLGVSYDVAALSGGAAISDIVGMTQWWWLLAIIALPLAGILALFFKRD